MRRFYDTAAAVSILFSLNTIGLHDSDTHMKLRPDPVNHPSHYTQHPTGVECIDIVECMTFNTGNAIKYLWRAGLKDSADVIEDLKKAVWYINREIERRNK